LKSRPAVSVVVPFSGDETAGRQTLQAMSAIELEAGDELVFADNSRDGALGTVARDGHLVVRATAERSSYHARNAGARATRAGEWLLFIDADCVPQPKLLDAYFSAPVPADCAVLAGQISGDRRQGGLMPRYARSRNYLSQTEGLHGKAGTAAATANLLVRRTAFDQAGGFAEGIRSGGDVDLCWRLRGAGWTLEYRHRAGVVHRHRETLRGFIGQVARYGAGAHWLDARHPGASPRWPLIPGLIGSARDVAANLMRGRLEEATFRAIDGLGLVAHNVGYRASNEAPRGSTVRPFRRTSTSTRSPRST
jgi:cellulose synthase/poly-beta-1,6-N-acetylglucosamine synthase-like glycosyltransferase